MDSGSDQDDRHYSLIEVHLSSTNCIFSLTLTISRGSGEVRFDEFYDYLSTPGDPGREYGYAVITPYTSLQALVDFLENRVGPGDGQNLEERLVACFRALVDRGDLGSGEGLRVNRDRVAAWWDEAGVPVKNDGWVWHND